MNNPYQTPSSDPIAGQTQVSFHLRDDAPVRVPAGRGASWLGRAVAASARGVVAWILYFLVIVILYGGALLVATAAESLGDVVGSAAYFLPYVVITILWGGAMAGCHPGRFELRRAFHGAQASIKPLAMLGFIFFLLNLPVFFVSAKLDLLFVDEAQMLTIIENGLMPIFVFYGALLLYYSVLMMAFWFAPALVTISGVEPVAALKASVKASWRNLSAFFMLGLMALAGTIALVVVFAVVMVAVRVVSSLGVNDVAPDTAMYGGMLVVGGIVYAIFAYAMVAVSSHTQYNSFCDVFLEQPEPVDAPSA